MVIDCFRERDWRYEDQIRNLQKEIKRLTKAIELHRERTIGHESCWENDVDLWKTIDPNATYPHGEQPSEEEFLTACKEYCQGRKCK